MRKSIYDPYFLYSSGLFGIMGMQTNDIFILAHNDFSSIEEDTIKSAMIMIKEREHLTFAHSLKFNDA